MSATETLVIEGDGVELDRIIWRRYRRRTPGLVEKTYDLNPGLADLGFFLPRGTVIVLPIDTPRTYPKIPLVKLW